MTAASDMLSAALALASVYGLKVIPVYWIANSACSCDRVTCPSPGKHPLTPHGARDATRDEAQIREWWERWPLANIGIASGPYDEGVHLVGIDLDVKDGKNGPQSFLKLAEAQPPLPPTYTTRTPSGGIHALFWSPRPVQQSQGRLGSGIDVRADGGFLVAPPSVGANGQRYVVVNDAHIAFAPDWLALAVEKKAKSKPKQRDQVEPQTVGAVAAALDGPPDLEDVKAWCGYEPFVGKLLGLYGFALGARFDPPWRTRSKQPAARVYRDERGLCIFHDFGAKGTPVSMIVPELYRTLVTGIARAAGEKEPSAKDMALWVKRAQVRTGYRVPDLPPLPPAAETLSEFDRAVYEVARERWALRQDEEEFPFTHEWVARWLGQPEKAMRVYKAIRRLRALALLVKVGERPTGNRPMYLYRLGNGTQQEREGA